MSRSQDSISSALAPVADGASLLDQVLAQTQLRPADEGYAVARRGVEAFVGALLAPGREARADRATVDLMISDIDRRLSRQLDRILHDPGFQRLESAWRGLKLLVDRSEQRENVRIHVLDASKDDLVEDFAEAPEVLQSGFYRTVYAGEYGQFGGEPYAAIIADYEFGPGAGDVGLLRRLGAVATMAHAPFIAAASPRFFGMDGFERLPKLNDIKALMEGPQYAKWNAFRDGDDARSVGLVLPRFLLRLPWGAEGAAVKAFDYREDCSQHASYCWGNAAFAFASRLTESFARHRWCPNIIGPQGGGTVPDLPLHRFEASGGAETKIPTEVLISERREYELAEEGFISLAMRKGGDDACFFSANSCQRPRRFGASDAGLEAERNHRLGTQLPYLFVVTRLAHYLKVLQREQIGSWKDRSTLARELNDWIGQYVVDMDDPPSEVRNRKPLRSARVTVEDVPGEAGWYQVGLQVRPHLKYMGASFTLSLVGRLDKER